MGTWNGRLTKPGKSKLTTKKLLNYRVTTGTTHVIPPIRAISRGKNSQQKAIAVSPTCASRSTRLYPCHVTFKGCPQFPARKERLQSHHVRSASNCNNVEIREMVTLWSHKMPVSLLLKMINPSLNLRLHVRARPVSHSAKGS